MIRVFIILWFAGLTLSLQAHTVNTVLLTFEGIGHSWQAKILLDASLAVPELRNDADARQPQREWLFTKPEEEYQMMREEAEVFLRESISFTHGNRDASYQLRFPDFEINPPDFPQLLNGGAYITVVLSGVLESDTGDFMITVADGQRPDVIVGIGANDEMKYLTVKTGSSDLIFTTNVTETDVVAQGSSWSLVMLGFTHVVPDGLDHILFILCLFLMARVWKLLLWQSLVFTIAHSLTLALVISGVLAIQQWPVWLSGMIEPLIAISILVLAIENLIRSDVSKHRLLVIFVFGLIHGLGFAGSLGTSLQQGGGWVFPLALANIGVELAQVSVLLVAWVLTTKLAQSANYVKFQKFASIMIAATAVWMIVDRLTG